MAVIPVIDASPIDTTPWNRRPMTVDEFYAFTDTRPDGEKWELIEGEPVLNASPSRLHQRVAGNVFFALATRLREIGAPWEASMPIGVRISKKGSARARRSGPP
jgi:Uma2 family endonuclease